MKVDIKKVINRNLIYLGFTPGKPAIADKMAKKKEEIFQDIL